MTEPNTHQRLGEFIEDYDSILIDTYFPDLVVFVKLCSQRKIVTQKASRKNPQLFIFSPLYFGILAPMKSTEEFTMTDELSRIMFGICLIASALVINLHLP